MRQQGSDAGSQSESGDPQLLKLTIDGKELRSSQKVSAQCVTEGNQVALIFENVGPHDGWTKIWFKPRTPGGGAQFLYSSVEPGDEKIDGHGSLESLGDQRYTLTGLGGGFPLGSEMDLDAIRSDVPFEVEFDASGCPSD